MPWNPSVTAKHVNTDFFFFSPFFSPSQWRDSIADNWRCTFFFFFLRGRLWNRNLNVIMEWSINITINIIQRMYNNKIYFKRRRLLRICMCVQWEFSLRDDIRYNFASTLSRFKWKKKKNIFLRQNCSIVVYCYHRNKNEKLVSRINKVNKQLRRASQSEIERSVAQMQSAGQLFQSIPLD